MAYADDIDALNPTYAFDFDGNATDRASAAATTATSIVYTGAALCEGVTNSMLTNAIADKLAITTLSGVFYNAAQTRVAIGGWFSTTAIQNPPKHIMTCGGSTAIKMLLGWGNALMFEAFSSGNYAIQVFGDVDLTANRKYHLFMVLEGNGFGNIFRCYLDGVPQLDADPVDRQPDFASLPARTTMPEFGNVTTSQVGGVTVQTLAPINGQYNEWAFFDGADAVISESDIRTELFEKGALPDNTITNQAGLDALADTVRADAPLCIRVTGNGTINLSADNVTFDPLASIHVQYTGTGTLNWTNTNGSNAEIGSVTNGGTIVFSTETTVTVTCLDSATKTPIENARVYLLDASEAVVINTLTNASGVATSTYNYVTDSTISSISKARKSSASPYYKAAPITGVLGSTGFSTTILMLGDE